MAPRQPSIDSELAEIRTHAQAGRWIMTAVGGMLLAAGMASLTECNRRIEMRVNDLEKADTQGQVWRAKADGRLDRHEDWIRATKCPSAISNASERAQ